jgi:selenide,water dikinase
VPDLAPDAQPQPERHLVLAGGGHCHALVLRSWVRRPCQRPSNCRITLVSRQPRTLYSGLVPALIAARVTFAEASIDLQRLCHLAGVAFLQAEIIGLNPLERSLLLRDQAPLRFDLLSLDVGAVVAGGRERPAVALVAQDLAPAGAHSPQAEEPGPEPPALELPIKPLEPLLERLERLERLASGRELRLRGGGAAAVELALALKARGHPCRLLLRGDQLRLGTAAAARAAERLLERAGIPLIRRAAATAPADLLCTGSRAPAWLAAAGLPVRQDTGRVLTDACLQVQGHPLLFACGDCAVVADQPRPAAGVWAVRAAPTLARNLRRRLRQPPRPLARWRPPARALQLLADPGEEPRAIACWGPWSWGPSRGLWRWKERIDRRFIASFAELRRASAAQG